MKRKIIHIDMDSFFASIEIRDNPKIRNMPVAVGGKKEDRGVISACNYIARKFGIYSSMPTFKAIQQCENLVLLPCKIKKYQITSEEIYRIFSNFTNEVESIGFDEAYLDVTNYVKSFYEAILMAKKIRLEIFRKVKLTSSAGISCNKLLAKISSKWNKPNGQFALYKKNDISRVLHKLSVDKLFGVGKITFNKLKLININTCGELQKIQLNELRSIFGHSLGTTLYFFSRGVDNRTVENNKSRKSLSIEKTFINYIVNLNTLLETIDMLYNDLLNKLGNHSSIKNQFLKIKNSNGKIFSKEQCSKEISKDIFYELVIRLNNLNKFPIKKVGIGIKFDNREFKKEKQLELFF